MRNKLVVQAWQGQTGNLHEWQDSTGAVLAKVDASGHATFANFATVHVASDVAFTSTTLVDITGLSFTTSASQTWSFEAYLEVVGRRAGGDD